MRVAATLATALLVTTAAAAGDPGAGPDQLAGVYKYRFKNGMVGGETFTSENILEIVPTGPAAAYVRAELAFFNGHQCSLAVIADWRNGGLIYRQPPEEGGCTLRIEVAEGRLRFNDDEAAPCRAYYCGARGTFEGISFPVTARRPIRYMDRLLASREYRAALAAHQGRPAPGQAGP